MVTPSECVRPPECQKFPNRYENWHRWTIQVCYQILEIYICLIPLMHNNTFDLFLSIKKVKVYWLWWNSSPICRATYYAHIISFGLIYRNIQRTWRCPDNFEINATMLKPPVWQNQKLCRINTGGYQCTKLKDLYWFLRLWMQIMNNIVIYFWL